MRCRGFTEDLGDLPDSGILSGRGVKRLFRDWFGVSSLILCPVVLIVYLSVWFGLDWRVSGRGVLGLLLLGVAPGYVVWRFVFGLRSMVSLESVIAWLLLGTLMTPPVWFVCSWVGLAWLFWVFFGVSVLLLIVFIVQQWVSVSALCANLSPVVAIVMWAGCGFVVLWSLSLSIVEFRDGDVHVMPYSDHVLHAMLVGELSRGVPAHTIPFIAGADKWAYHQMPDVWCDLLRRVSGASTNDAYFYLALPLRYFLISLGCFLAICGRFGRLSGLSSMVCLLAFSGFFGIQMFANGLMVYLFLSYPTAFGLMGVFLILYCLSLLGKDSAGRIFTLAVVLAMSLLWYKANYALVVVPAVTTVAVLMLYPRREWGWLGVCVGVLVVIGVVRLFDIASADMGPDLLMRPGMFLSWWWELKFAPDSVFRMWVDGWPIVLKWPIMLLTCVVFRFHTVLFSMLYLAWRFQFGRGDRALCWVDRTLLLMILFLIAGLVALPVQRGAIWNVSMHNLFLVLALGLCLMGPVVVDIAGWMFRRRGSAVVIVALFCASVFVDNVLALRRTALWSTRVGSGVVGKDMYACYRFIRDTSPSDALVMIPSYREGRSPAGLLTGRRLVLENGEAWKTFYDTAPLLSDLDRFYSDAQSDERSLILDKYAVDYFVSEHPIHMPDRVSLVFEHGGVMVYRVGPSTGNVQAFASQSEFFESEFFESVLTEGSVLIEGNAAPSNIANRDGG